MSEVHLDHPGDWRWYGGRPAVVVGPCPHATCPHDGARGIADGPDYEHYVLLQCDVPDGCAGQCRGWMAEWPEGEGPGGRRWRVPEEWLQVQVSAPVVSPGEQP